MNLCAFVHGDTILLDTFRDVMCLVKTLGECYVCVILVTTVRDMAHIYANSGLTSITANGAEVSCGLRGTGGPSKDRTGLVLSQAVNSPFWIPIDNI